MNRLAQRGRVSDSSATVVRKRKVARPVNPELEEAIAAGMPNCPNYHGQNTRPSAPYGFHDAFLAVFGLIPFRCRVCQYRFYRRPMKYVHPPVA